jgi:hypothetical protein
MPHSADAVSSASAGSGPLDHASLSDLARGTLKAYFASDGLSIDSDAVYSLWNRIVESATTNNVPERYLTAACNALTVMISSGIQCDDAEVRQLFFSRSLWEQGYSCVEFAFSCGKTKPALQVLETLTLLLKANPDLRSASEALSFCAEAVIRTIMLDEPCSKLKAACITLSCLLRRTSVRPILGSFVDCVVKKDGQSWARRCALHHLPADPANSGALELDKLFLALVFAINGLETRSAALKLFGQLCMNSHLTKEEPVVYAGQVLEYYIRHNEGSLGEFAENAFPVILDNRDRYEAFLEMYRPKLDGNDSRLILYLIVLKIGRLKSFIAEDGLLLRTRLAADTDILLDVPMILGSDFRRIWPPGVSSPANNLRTLRMLLRAGNAAIRVHAYDLLTASFATKASISSQTLACVMESFPHLLEDNDAYERGEVLAVTRRFLKRLDNSNVNLRKLQSFGKLGQENRDFLEEYHKCVQRLTELLTCELEVGKSYQRHIIALQILHMLSKTSFAEVLDIRDLFQRTITLVSDAYEDVRASSANLLKSIEMRKDAPDNTIADARDKMLRVSADTCRHDHADAAGRMVAVADVTKHTYTDQPGLPRSASHDDVYRQISDLQTYLTSIEVLRPDTRFPLHAAILGLVHTYSQGKLQLHHIDGLIWICQRLWALVHDILCVDSPETGTEDVDDESLGGPKDLLAYCWRALRDSNLLLQEVIKKSHTHIGTIGSLSMDQLIQLRHRGAFSTVAQTFALSCDGARFDLTEANKSLLRKWQALAFREIDMQARKVTRRSAGLPALFTALVSTTNDADFQEVISRLKDIAQKEPEQEHLVGNDQFLPQVHALNCIKDILVNSKFRTITESHVSSLVELAAERMSSPIWPIRNCGLMLLRACISRLSLKVNYCHSNGHSTSLNISKQPVVVALELLESLSRGAGSVHMSSSGSEQTFAALDLVRHVGHTPTYDERLNLLIRVHLRSPAWAVRDHAARVLAARVTLTESWQTVLHSYSLHNASSENELHGLLLFHRYVHEILGEHISQNDLEKCSHIVASQASLVFTDRSSGHSPVVQAAYLDLVISIMSEIPSRYKSEDLAVDSILRIEFTMGTRDWDLRQRQVLYLMLAFVLGRELDWTALSAYLQTCPVDGDGCRFAAHGLKRIIERLPHDTQHPRIGCMLTWMIKTWTTNEAQSTTMHAIADCLEQSKAAFLANEIVEIYDHVVGMLYPTDRNVQNAALRLQALLFRQLRTHVRKVQPREIEHWTSRLSSAANDELEAPTRLNAAVTVRVSIAGLLSNVVDDDAEMRGALPVRLLNIVYNQLNDDDEEVRELAQYSVLECCKALGENHRLLIRPCSLAGRQELLDIMATRFAKNEFLSLLAYSKLICVDRSSSGRLQQTQSVSSKLSEIVQSMAELFAAERQNLYVDELSEIQAWSRLLRLCTTETPMNPTILLEGLKWCCDGIDALQTVAATEQEAGAEGTSSTMGMSYNFDILELCMRVATLAQTLASIGLRSKTSDAAVEVKRVCDEVTEKLQNWRVATLDLDLHPLLRATLDGEDLDNGQARDLQESAIDV